MVKDEFPAHREASIKKASRSFLMAPEQ